MKRVYICHTFYHAYISVMKELLATRDEVERNVTPQKATLLLSTMSNDFGNVKERIDAVGVFGDIFLFDEKEDVTSEEVMAYHKDKGNIVLNLLQRIKYTKLLGKLQEPYIPVDLKGFDEVYVFCDSDPIGYYLNYKKIKYHSMEDGLNCGILDNMAMLSNRGAWSLKKAMASMGLIFIENGYSKYCIDYVVNDISKNYMPPKNIVEEPFDDMWSKLTDIDHEIMARIFIEDIDELRAELLNKGADKPKVMILTEPLCELNVRKKIFGDIVDMYKEKFTVIIKPHPRDELDYAKEFPEVIVLRGRFPMEVINDVEDLKVDSVVSVITQIGNIKFADKIEYLGLDFLDKYEAPEVHRKMEDLTGKKVEE